MAYEDAEVNVMCTEESITELIALLSPAYDNSDLSALLECTIRIKRKGFSGKILEYFV